MPEILRTPSGQDRARAAADRRRRRAPARRAGRAPQRRHGPRRPPRPALEQLVAAQPAEDGQRARRAAPPTCTPTTPPGSAWPTARTRACRRAPARSWCPSRSPRTSCPASSRSRTAGATTAEGTAMGVAEAHAGVNSNVLDRRARGRAAVGHRRSSTGSRSSWRRCARPRPPEPSRDQPHLQPARARARAGRRRR